MILVTVGTEQYPFNALMDWVDLLIKEGIINEEVTIQYGSSTRFPDDVKVSKVMPESQFRKYIEQSSAVIAHCGEGTALLLEDFDKPYILVPRTSKFHEHVDNHQLEMADDLENQGVLIARSPADLAKFLKLITISRKALTFAEDKYLCDYLSDRYPSQDYAKLMLVCSSGGHFKGLQGLRQYWQTYSQRTWITFKTGTTATELTEEKAYWAYSPTNRNIPNLVRNLLLAIRLLRKERPALVLSTGAGVSVPFLVAAKYLCKSKIIFVESKTRIRDLSLSARLLRALKALDLLIVRAEEIAHLYPEAVFIPMGSDHESVKVGLQDVQIASFHDTILISTPQNIFNPEARKLKDDFRQLCQEEDSFRKIIIDMSKTNFIDSSGVGALVSCLKVLREMDSKSDNLEPTELVLWSVNVQVLAVLKMTNLDEIFHIEPATRTNRFPSRKSLRSLQNKSHRIATTFHRVYQALINIPVICAIAYVMYFFYPAIELDPIVPVHPSVRSFPKRLLDIVGALIGLSITAILFVPIAIAIKLESQGPILFKQKRAGLMSKPFGIWKFRSMVKNAEMLKQKVANEIADSSTGKSTDRDNGKFFKNSNDPRITKVGKFLRKMSFDEFPQFWNILIGDMSLIGTRPPTFGEVGLYELENEYTDEKMTEWSRLDVKPGLSGVWQVSGRSSVRSFEEVMNFDLTYKKNWNFGYDLWLIWKTIAVLFERNNAAV
ncbi:STAS domain-containing protein [Pseudanabaena sp. UWO311]|uniref:sugar transferase n=1 Tax=Pseudanabaena sp. UWO311 TaxID=2487337 RepID=UPI001156DF2C|nr:sugar transferase [Pseudanabaena sp. UWO311]TYQ26709.1 STAS domain-containing protein [Pseudanabaena sp. UWO311]